jgi:hypothetical protein
LRQPGLYCGYCGRRSLHLTGKPLGLFRQMAGDPLVQPALDLGGQM